MESSDEEIENESEGKPSTCSSKYWIYARNKTNVNNKEPGEKCGKWMIFDSIDKIDDTWDVIKVATESGKLGHASKVSTIKEKPVQIGGGSSNAVICIYTYDWTDEADVFRIRKALRELGFTKTLHYKSDADTLAGVYRTTGHKNVSKYSY